MYSVVDAFPTALYKSKIGLTEQEIKFITSKSKDTEQLVYSNYMSNETYLLDSNELLSLKQRITNHLNVYIREVVGYDIEMCVTQSWSNYNPKGSSHHTHKHRNSIISGVIYLTDAPAPFILMKPDDQLLVPDTLKPTTYNMPVKPIDVEKDDIFLFPSHIRHGVMQNTSDATRISLAFNSFYTGILGNDKQAMMKLEIK